MVNGDAGGVPKKLPVASRSNESPGFSVTLPDQSTELLVKLHPPVVHPVIPNDIPDGRLPLNTAFIAVIVIGAAQ